MPSHVAFIRAINVGGHAKVSMEALRKTLVGRGLASVRTLLQSGNVVFDASNTDVAELAATIRQALLDDFTVDTDIMIRTRETVRQVVESNPFFGREFDHSKLHVLFLKKAPDEEAFVGLAPSKDPSVEYVLVDRELYMYCENGMGRAILPDPQRLFGTTATARNWNTVLKVAALLEE